MSIVITDKAISELQKLEIGGDQFLRIKVVSGGCSGMTYSAAIDTVFNAENDEVIFENDELKVVGESGTMIFLEGLEIDFSDDLIKSGFRFKNPNASGSCGCGSSFAG